MKKRRRFSERPYWSLASVDAGRFSTEHRVEEAASVPDRDSWLSLDPYEATIELLLLLDRCTMRRNASGWVEETANHIFRIPLTEQVARSPRFVHVVRCPEGVLPSLHKARIQWGRMKP
jgi:hypothetical protein